VAAAGSMGLQLKLLIIHDTCSWQLRRHIRWTDGQSAPGMHLPHLPVRYTQKAAMRRQLALAAGAPACKPVAVALDHGISAHSWDAPPAACASG
jgi:hypothetical protein